MALTKGTPNSIVVSNAASGAVSLTYTAMGGSNRKLVFCVCFAHSVSIPTVVNGTLDGANLTEVGRINNGTTGIVVMFEKNDAASGALTWTASGSNAHGALGYIEWSGADSGLLVPTTNTGSSGSITVTTTGTTAGDAVVAGFAHYDAENTPHGAGGGQTIEWDVNAASNLANGYGTTKAAGGDITQTENITNTRAWAAVQTVVKAAGAAATPGFMWLS